MWDSFPRAPPQPNRRVFLQPSQDQQFVSLSGPDGTKVGTDFSVQMGFFVQTEKNIAAVACPQALSFRSSLCLGESVQVLAIRSVQLSVIAPAFIPGLPLWSGRFPCQR